MPGQSIPNAVPRGIHPLRERSPVPLDGVATLPNYLLAKISQGLDLTAEEEHEASLIVYQIVTPEIRRRIIPRRDNLAGRNPSLATDLDPTDWEA